jgi:hypothetical protein
LSRSGSSLLVWDDLGRQPEGWLYLVYANSETGLGGEFIVMQIFHIKQKGRTCAVRPFAILHGG